METDFQNDIEIDLENLTTEVLTDEDSFSFIQVNKIKNNLINY